MVQPKIKIQKGAVDPTDSSKDSKDDKCNQSNHSVRQFSLVNAKMLDEKLLWDKPARGFNDSPPPKINFKRGGNVPF